MKNLKYYAGALLFSAFVFASCNTNPEPEPEPGPGPNPPAPPVSEMPEVAATDGAVTVVWNIVDAAVCNGLVFAGDYNGYNTDPEQMVKFEAIEGFEGWYKAVIVPADGNTGIVGKPCQLDGDGSFPASWDFQWHPLLADDGSISQECEVIKGTATLEPEYTTERKLVVSENSTVVYVRSYAFKADACAPKEYITVTFNLTAPAMHDSCIVYIVGAMNSWNLTATPMNKTGEGWTITLDEMLSGMEYKYAVNGAFWEAATVEGKECFSAANNRKIDDRTMNDEVPGFLGINADECTDPIDIVVTVPAGTEECHIAGSMNSWTQEPMTKADDGTFVYSYLAGIGDEFKITRTNSWDTEGLFADGEDKENGCWTKGGNIIMESIANLSVEIAAWSDEVTLCK